MFYNLHTLTPQIMLQEKDLLKCLWSITSPTLATYLSQTIEAVDQLIVDFNSIHFQVSDALVKTQAQYTKYTNKAHGF